MIRVLLADDQAMVRSGFEMILSVEDDIEVVGSAVNGLDAIEKAFVLRPHVVLMDVQMPVMDGITATRELVEGGTARVVVLTTFDRDDYLFDALEAGASGFLLKNSEPELLVEAIRAVASGRALLSPDVTLRVIRRMTHREPVPTSRPPVALPAGVALTGRELDVLKLVAEGMSNAEVAASLFVSETTVKTHMSNVLAKLGLRDRVQAVVWAHRAAIVE